MGYLFVLCKVFTNLGESISIKLYNQKHTKGGMLFTGIISLFAMLFFLFSDANGFQFDWAVVPYAAAFGVIYCVAYLLTFVALACGSFTMTMLIISYSLIFPILYGIFFLKESCSVYTYLGFVLLALSLFLVRGQNQEQGGQKMFSLKWLIAVVITSVGNGVLGILQKMQQLRFNNAYNNEFMVIALVISAAALLIGGVIKDRRDLKEILRYGTPYAGAAGVCNGLNNMLGLWINNLLPLSISAPLVSGVKIVLSFFSSRLLFHEKYIKRQIVGVAIGAAALIFLNL